MSRPLLLGVLALAAGGLVVAFHGGKAAPATALPAAVERELRNRDVAFYEERAARDPFSAADRTALAGLYMQRARETGNYGDYLRAERWARASLALRVAHNEAAFQLLAGSLMAQHRFSEALEVARVLSAANPEVTSYRALLGEVQLELGQYDSARVTFAALAAAERELAVAPRLARWREIEGHPGEARRILERAQADARKRRDLPREQVAWFSLRVGDLALRTGRLHDAAKAYREGLRVFPDDYRIWGALARLAALRHRWREAAEDADRAIAIALDPSALAVAIEAYQALGEGAQAEEYLRAMEGAVFDQPGPLHPGWSLFLLDQGRRVGDVLARAESDLEVRRDIYTYDVYAWALHRAGRQAEARRAIARALSRGTRDAVLFYHAGMIELALGNVGGARFWLREALAVNPHFDPWQVAVARATLDSLERRGAGR